MHAESFSSKQILRAVTFTFLILFYLRKKILRGALTNGRDWIFILVTFNDNFDGATYKQSDVVSIIHYEGSDGQIVIPSPRPDLIAAILLHWVSSIPACLLEFLSDTDISH